VVRTDGDPVEVGMKFGGFHLEAELGEGGTARVFKASPQPTGVPVALKLLKLPVSVDPGVRRRFLREARAAREVSHPCLVAVDEVGVVEERPYLTMPLIDGTSLERKLGSDGALEIGATVAVLDQLCDAVGALHAAGLTHRDIKPANVLLGPGGAFLTDFGLARGRDYTAITAVGGLVGTLAYLAPELIRGEEGGPRADVYALGCLAYQCLAGRPPFAGNNMFTLGMAVLEEMPPGPCANDGETAARVNLAVRRAMAKDPTDRPGGAEEFARSLRLASSADTG
jgi:serine/threonine protein kinase